MKKSALLRLLAFLLLSGCTEPARETRIENGSPRVADSTDAVTTPSDESSAADSHAEAAARIDAARLLASTLEKAKLEDKRVLVHLGAPG